MAINQVFISYRHESAAHARDVCRLGEDLRRTGLSVALDQFYMDEHPGGPDEGWPKWCEDHATGANCVFVIASEGWFAAYDKKSAVGGLGAATEADLFRTRLYNQQGLNERLRMVFLHEVAIETVPKHLRPWHRFHPFASATDLEGLVRWVGQRLGMGVRQAAFYARPPPVQKDQTSTGTSAAPLGSRKKLFICHARKDQTWGEQLEDYLAALKRRGVVVSWYDGMVRAGEPWEEVIQRKLGEEELVLIFVSPALLASEYVMTVELPKALNVTGKGNAEFCR